MKVLVFAPFACAQGHHETDVEVAIGHLKKGDDVHVIQCHKELTLCDPNPLHTRMRCVLCHSTSNRSFQLAGIPKGNMHALSLPGTTDPKSFPTFKTLFELRDYEWQGMPVGYAVCSSCISLERNTNPTMEKYQFFVQETLMMWVEVYQAMVKHLKEIRPDAMYVFNARTGVTSAAFQAAKSAGVKSIVCDRDFYDSYTSYENSIAIDLEASKKRIAALAEIMKQDPEGERIATEWFEKRKNQKKEISGDFLADQVRDRLPAGFSAARTNVALFISSEDELFISPGWRNPIYLDQCDSLRKIVEALPGDKYHFYARIHPNLKGIDNQQMADLNSLSAPNLTLIQPSDDIDTYALAKACDKVISFGSTVGLEAIYLGRPSILIGHSLGEDLGGFYIPKTHAEVIALIQSDLKPLPAKSVLPYAYWILKAGTKFQHIIPWRSSDQPSGIVGEHIQRIKPGLIARLILKVAHRIAYWRMILRRQFFDGKKQEHPLEKLFILGRQVTQSKR